MATVLDELIVKIGPEFVNLDKLRGFENRMERFKRNVDRAAGALFRVGAAATAAGTAPLLAFAKYEENIAKIEGLVGVNREQLDLWYNDIAAIAIAVGIGPAQLSDALYDITSAGLRGQVAMDVLEASAKAAAAGLGDQKSIADLATSAINAYGEETLSATEAVDHLTEAVRLGKLPPETLASAMGRALPVASAMGVQFSEVAGILAAMSRTGTNAEEGVTQLNAVMLALLKPADSAHKELDRVGLSIDGLRKMAAGPQGLWGVLRELKTAFGDNIEAMTEIFPNVRALRGVFDLLGPGLAANNELLMEMKDSTGVTEEALAAMADTLAHQWRRAVATMNVALVMIGTEMAGTARKAIDFAQRMLEAFTQLPASVKAMVAQVLTIGPALLAAAAALKVLSIGLGIFTPLVVTVTKLGGLIRALGPALLSVSALNPWILGLTAAAGALIVAWEPVSSFFRGVFSGLIDGAGEIAAAFGRLMDELGPVGEGIRSIFDGVGSAWNALMFLFADVDGSDAGQGFGQSVAGAISAVIDSITSLIGIWNRLVGLITQPLAVLFETGSATAAMDAFRLALSDLVDWLFGTLDFSALGSGLANIWSGASVAMEAFRQELVNLSEWLFGAVDFSEYGRRMIDTLIAGVMSVKDALTESVSGAFDSVRKLLPFSDAEEGPLSRLTESGRAIVDTIADGVRSAKPLRVALTAGALSLPTIEATAEIIPHLTDQRVAQAVSSIAPLFGGAEIDDGAQGGGLPFPDLDRDILQSITRVADSELPVAPYPSPPIAAASDADSAPGAQGATINLTFGQGAIQIDAQGGDAREIANGISERLGESMRAVAEQLDSKVIA